MTELSGRRDPDGASAAPPLPGSVRASEYRPPLSSSAVIDAAEQSTRVVRRGEAGRDECCASCEATARS